MFATMARMSPRPRVLSGIQPTADSFHIGNYLGALRNWVALQQTHECFYCIVDLHAITVPHDPALLRHRTRVGFAQLLALGIDPEHATVFVQSHVPEHTELQWILACLTGFGEASRMTQFKDKSQKVGSDTTSVGLFTYPILQAADILVYRANAVPVGEDQRQHLELTRDLANRFNTRFGQTLVVPEALIVKDTAKIVDLTEPTAKMSKQTPAGCVFLLDPPKKIEKKIKAAVTDSQTEVRFDPEAKPGVSNLLTILATFTGRTVEEVEPEFAGRMYGDLKTEAAAAVVEFAIPFQSRVTELMDDPAELDRLMGIGAARARALASATLADVRANLGLVIA
jgi:tryptophanyl-tRNA synthetase